MLKPLTSNKIQAARRKAGIFIKNRPNPFTENGSATRGGDFYLYEWHDSYLTKKSVLRVILNPLF